MATAVGRAAATNGRRRERPDPAPASLAGTLSAVPVPSPGQLERPDRATLVEVLDDLGDVAAPQRNGTAPARDHVADAERVFSYRLLRVARGDTTPLPGFDQDVFVGGADFDRLPLSTLLADFEVARASTLSLLETVDREALERRGVASGEPVSARALVYILAGHAEHHLRGLRERYRLGS